MCLSPESYKSLMPSRRCRPCIRNRPPFIKSIESCLPVAGAQKLCLDLRSTRRCQIIFRSIFPDFLSLLSTDNLCYHCSNGLSCASASGLISSTSGSEPSPQLICSRATLIRVDINTHFCIHRSATTSQFLPLVINQSQRAVSIHT